MFPPLALQLYCKGINTLAELQAALDEDPHLLDAGQKVWLKHHGDIVKPIPRAEVEQHFNYIKGTVEKLFPNNELEVMCVGSYRRLKDTCGDVDIFIVPNHDNYFETEIEPIVERLQSDGYLVDIIGQTEKYYLGHDDLSGRNVDKEVYQCPHTVFGIGRLPGTNINRRVDLIFQPKKEKTCGLLYFTGSRDFNTAIAKFASRQVGGWWRCEQRTASARRTAIRRATPSTTRICTSMRAAHTRVNTSPVRARRTYSTVYSCHTWLLRSGRPPTSSSRNATSPAMTSSSTS